MVEYDLAITAQTVSPAGRPVRGLVINGGIPGPVLRFREGDVARIRVHNRLKHEETSTHWHGLLLPNEQDGVPHVTTSPIQPGGTHVFEFPLTHAGTYWYHSHTHLQEQSGVYGSIVVLPRGGEPVRADHDEVLVFSDWTNLDPHEVQRTLMRGSDYFALKRRQAPSVWDAAAKGQLGAYFAAEWLRMPPMDVADVGYDAFLINGQRQATLRGRPGERLRLRLVNAAAATYFYIHASSGPMTIVAADGPPVQPVQVDRFLMAIAETYDVIVTIPASGKYELRATAQDGSGHVSAFYGAGTLQPATDPPKASLYQMDEMLELALAEQEKDPRAALRLPRPGSPYRVLRAVRDTRLPAALPRRKISLRLTGDMTRYVWSFDGKTIAEEPYIHIKKGEAIEMELVNDTMMHHPIHLHGHFFRLLMGQGARSPLKHTVDVPPMSRRTLEFEANEEKDWMLHCHILYHMMSGMARVVRYDDAPASASASTAHVASAAHDTKPSHVNATHHAPGHSGGLGEHAHDMTYLWGAASFQSHMSEGLLTWMSPKNDLLLSWEIGWGNVQDTEYEIDALYQRYFTSHFQAFAGARLTNGHDAKNRAVAGFNYQLPLRVWAAASVDSEGDARVSLSKELQLTARLAAFASVRYDTNTEWEWSAGADFTLTRTLSLTTQYHSEYGFGAGVLFRF